jgi:Mg2+ and Co2+ transporter CorA
MPALEWHCGYYATLFAMANIGIVMVNYFWQEEKMVIRGN